eukprot:9710497-Karenia_brevis.AAC.1
MYPKHPQVKPYRVTGWQSCIEHPKMSRNFNKGVWGHQAEVAAHVFSFMAHQENKRFLGLGRDQQVDQLSALGLTKGGDKWARSMRWEEALYLGTNKHFEFELKQAVSGATLQHAAPEPTPP